MKFMTAPLTFVLLMVGLLPGAALAAEFSVADRVLLAEHHVTGQKQIPILIATPPERTAAIAAELQRQGAQVLGRRDGIGYLYIWMPPGAVESLTRVDGIQALQVAAMPVRAGMGPDDNKGSADAAPRKKISQGAPPSPTTPLDNPYTGEAATQALTFKQTHPTFDGRGIVAAFVEPAAPNLATLRGALDLAGKPVAKIPFYDLASQIDAVAPTGGGWDVWQQTEAVTPDAQGQFKWLDSSYRLPANVKPSSTKWRICRRLAVDGLESVGPFDILWAVDKQKVWVLPKSVGNDFSQAQSVSLTERVPWIAIGDAASRRATLVAPQAFVFAADRKRLWLASAVTHAAHAGMVGSVMVGAGFMGGQVNGIAPAAQVAIYHSGRSRNAPSYAGIEVQLGAVADPRVELAQASYAIGDTGRFGDVSPQQLWIDRLIRKNRKPFVKAHGNYGARWFEVDEFSAGDEVFAVGAYTPRETWRANMGVALAAEHTPASYSGWGPADDGGLKPDFLGLTHTLTEGMGNDYYWKAPGFEQYAVSGGTSAGAPNGAGHLILLMSAAKQTGIPYDVARLRAAVATTAKFLEGVEARAQGHGLIQVDDAWTALQRAAKWQPSVFKIQAPLVGAESKDGGPQRLVGRGLFELSGWHAGQTGQRTLTVTRTAGRAQDSRYRLRWKGSVDVFSSAQQEVELPLGKAISIPVDIRTSSMGSSSAILDLVDPQVDLVAGSVLCTVMVSDALPANGTALKYQRQAQRLGSTLFFVDVPADLSAITVQLDKDDTQGYWYAQDPTGRKLPFDPYGSEVAKGFNPAEMKVRSRTLTYADPVPGVWQFVMQIGEPRSMQDLEAVEDWAKPMPLSVQIYGWPAQTQQVDETVAGQTTQIAFKNPHQDIKAAIKAVGVGAARLAEVKLQPGLRPTFFEVTVDPGAAKLQVRLAHTTAGARIGLYVYKVPEGERLEKADNLASDATALAYYEPSFRSDKQYELLNPPSGRYRIALDPIHVPPQGVMVSYQDTVYHPVYGSVEISEGARAADTAGQLTTQATVAVRAQPEEGRRWIAEVGLFNSQAGKDSLAIATQRWFIGAQSEH